MRRGTSQGNPGNNLANFLLAMNDPIDYLSNRRSPKKTRDNL